MARKKGSKNKNNSRVATNGTGGNATLRQQVDELLTRVKLLENERIELKNDFEAKEEELKRQMKEKDAEYIQKLKDNDAKWKSLNQRFINRLREVTFATEAVQATARRAPLNAATDELTQPPIAKQGMLDLKQVEGKTPEAGIISSISRLISNLSSRLDVIYLSVRFFLMSKLSGQ